MGNCKLVVMVMVGEEYENDDAAALGSPDGMKSQLTSCRFVQSCAVTV